jgi:hypothetical protein
MVVLVHTSYYSMDYFPLTELSRQVVESYEEIVDATIVSLFLLISLMVMVLLVVHLNVMDYFDSNLPDDSHSVIVVDVIVKMLHLLLAHEAMNDSKMMNSEMNCPMAIESLNYVATKEYD